MKKLLLAAVGVAAFAWLWPAKPTIPSVVRDQIGNVVRIDVLSIEKGKIEQGLGAGVVVSPEGHILTCAHVIENAQLVMVTPYGKHSPSVAVVLRRDRRRDLALLKVPLKGVAFSRVSKEKPFLGEEVVAIGHPFGRFWSVTAGIVSGLHREGLAINLLQTDAAINPGNSGGPLFNMKGEIVALNESRVSNGDNMGFSVPTEEIRKFLSIFKGLEKAQ